MYVCMYVMYVMYVCMYVYIYIDLCVCALYEIWEGSIYEGWSEYSGPR